MADVIHLVRVAFESVAILNRGAWAGTEARVYFLPRVGGQGRGRSRPYRQGDATQLDLRSQEYSWDFVLEDAGAPLSVELTAFDELLLFGDGLDKLSDRVVAPWQSGPRAVTSARGQYALRYHVETLRFDLRVGGTASAFRQVASGTRRVTLALPNVAQVKLVAIRGLHKPRAEGARVEGDGRIQNTDHVPGYTSEDDQGRIFINRDPDGNWVDKTQFIELTAEIHPATVRLPPGITVVWTVEDPDDPTNDDPRMRRDAGRILDPNDYTAGLPSGARGEDNDPSEVTTTVARFEAVAPMFALSNNETLVDVATRTTKVRFHVSNVAGVNYRVRATLKAHPQITAAVPARTGAMTVWNRIQVEYVKMTAARPLPVDRLAAHFDPARAQIDIEPVRIVRPAWEKPLMGLDFDAARAECDTLATASHGEFRRAGQAGWFFLASAVQFTPPIPETVLFEGFAEARGRKLRLLPTAAQPVRAGKPGGIEVYDPAVAPHQPGLRPDRKRSLFFKISARYGNEVYIAPHDFYEVDNPDYAFMLADLTTYGFGEGEGVFVRMYVSGGSIGGISPGTYRDPVTRRTFFAGRLIVFTGSGAASDAHTLLMTHELGHAFDNAHKCGNWDWQNKPSRTSCTMCYEYMWVLRDPEAEPEAEPPPPPVPLNEPWRYTVQDGDYPVKIALNITADANRWRELVDANCPPKSRDPATGNFREFRSGERLLLPQSWVPFVRNEPRPRHVTGPFIETPRKRWYYVVQSGDYPVKIAQNITGDATRWPEFVDVNCPPKIRERGSFKTFSVGERLLLPDSWAPFVMDSRPNNVVPEPRKPIPWSQERQSPHFCARHLRRLRDYHLEDNPGLAWGATGKARRR